MKITKHFLCSLLLIPALAAAEADGGDPAGDGGEARDPFAPPGWGADAATGEEAAERRRRFVAAVGDASDHWRLLGIAHATDGRRLGLIGLAAESRTTVYPDDVLAFEAGDFLLEARVVAISNQRISLSVADPDGGDPLTVHLH